MTKDRALARFLPLNIWRERGESVSDGRRIPDQERIAQSLATLIDILESRGVLSAEDVGRILGE